MKCKQFKKGLTLCKSLNDRTEPGANSKCKGFIRVVMVNLEKGFNEKFVGVAYKRSAKDPCVFLNFCPYCGEKITPAVKDGCLVW